MPVEKLRPTYTFNDDRLAELKQVVPEAFEDGKVNWETLRDVLEGHLEDEDQEEHFGLSWPGKRQARQLASQPSKGTLVPVPGEGVNEDDTRNLFIEGDNLEVLKLLQKSYAGRVKMIYIDPPYNTGNDFIYKDDYSEPLKSYLKRTNQIDEDDNPLTTSAKTSGRFHSRWLNMIYPRLKVARTLLKNDGLVFVSIDDNEAHNLRHLMNEIFGEENYLTTFHIQVRYPDKTLTRDSDFHKMTEMVFVYGKSQSASVLNSSSAYSFEKFKWEIREIGDPTIIELDGKEVSVFPQESYEIKAVEPGPNKLKEIWASGKILDGNSSGRFFRDNLSGRYIEDGYKVLYKVPGIGDDKFDFRYFTGPKREGATKGKYYQGVPTEVLKNPESHRSKEPVNTFHNFADSFGNCRHEGGVGFRSGKKPIRFIKTLMELTLRDKKNDIVLDFFAGWSAPFG